MKEPKTTSIQIDITEKNGYYLITSPHLEGLYLASMSFKAALKGLGKAVYVLIRDGGLDGPKKKP